MLTHRGKSIKEREEIAKTTEKICEHIESEHRKGKIPLFIIGSGVSRSLFEDSRGKSRGIPNMIGMIAQLKDISFSSFFIHSLPNDLKNLFELWESSDDRKKDRSIVSRILMYFKEQDQKGLQDIWSEFISWLLYKCVDEKKEIGMLNVEPSPAHTKIAEMYKKANAICLTINFDSLMYKALSAKFDEEGKIKKKNAYTYFEPKGCEEFFKRMEHPGAVAEIQARGDVFWAECKTSHCNLRNKQIPLLISEEYGLRDNPTKCPGCKGPRNILIAFPGTYEKDREMQAMLSVIWRYLAYKISCVITIGLSGAWDPILIAFLSDLLGERDVRLVDVNIHPEDSDLVKTLIIGSNVVSIKQDADKFMDARLQEEDLQLQVVSINQDANKFMEEFVEKYDKPTSISPISFEFKSSPGAIGYDYHWGKILNLIEPHFDDTTDFEKALINNSIVAITERFTQLGLKSRWLGIKNRDHNRLSHSKGVMKLASFIYEKVCKNSNREPKDNEKQFLRIAALLHDIGHLPFCHMIEEIFKELNWKPGGYVESFSHGVYTERKIKKLEENELKKELEKIGYTTTDLIRLINGEFGVGFLDAILNSPVDVDKIDYVFRDARCTSTPISLTEKDFLLGLIEEAQITSEGLLAFSGYSARLAIELFNAREYLYNNLYLTPEIRFLESAVRFIITTYFVHKYNIINWEKKEVSKAIKDVKKITHGISDLGALRIQLVINDLEVLVEKKNKGAEDDIELAILEEMKNWLLSAEIKPIRQEIKDAIGECYKLVSTTDRKEELLKIGSKYIIHSEELEKVSGPLKRLENVAKTVMLRFPGVILIDILPSFKYLSISEKRRKKERSDGTLEDAEYILIPSGNPRYWRKGRALANTSLIGSTLDKEKEFLNIYLYRISKKESEVTQAVDLFHRLLIEEKLLLEEVE